MERNREAPRGGGGWFRENTVIICGGGFSWEFSRPLINHGEHDRRRQINDIQSQKRGREFPTLSFILFDKTYLL